MRRGAGLGSSSSSALRRSDGLDDACRGFVFSTARGALIVLPCARLLSTDQKRHINSPQDDQGQRTLPHSGHQSHFPGRLSSGFGPDCRDGRRPQPALLGPFRQTEAGRCCRSANTGRGRVDTSGPGLSYLSKPRLAISRRPPPIPPKPSPPNLALPRRGQRRGCGPAAHRAIKQRVLAREITGQ